VPAQRKRPAARTDIAAPQLPDQLAEVAGLDSIADQASHSQQALTDCEFSNQTADDVLFEQVSCKRVRLNQTHLTLAQLFDVGFDGCDLAGAELEKAHLRRVEFTSSRLVGVKLSDASLEDVLIHKCNCEFARFWSSSFKAARFHQCVLREASFEGTDLSGVIFRDCDLSRADFRNTKLKGADFRGSTISGIQIGVKDTQGAIFSPAQAIQLVSLFGVTVQEENDSPSPDDA
jgi:uncharacterized protein YjbI with pentapeptide repeats